MRFSGFDDEWIEEKLGNLVQIKSGECTKNLITGIDNSIPYFKVEQLNNSLKYQIKTPYFINDKSKIVNKGSIIFPKRGAAILLNKIRILNQDSFMDTNLMTLTPNNKLYNEFLYYFIYKENLSKIADTTSIPQLNNKHIKPYPIKLPSFEEQLKISKFISSVDKKVALLSQNLEIFNDFKKGLLQQIFTQKLRFDFDEIRLKSISKINKGKQLNKEHMLEIGKFYVLNGGQEPSGYTDSWNTSENTITISEGGNSCGFVNFNTEKFWSGGHCYYLNKLSENIDVYYLYSYLKFIEPQIMRLRVGSGLTNIQKGDIENIKIKILPKKEQIKISNLLLSTDNKISSIESQKDSFEIFKKGLLQQMFVVQLILSLLQNKKHI